MIDNFSFGIIAPLTIIYITLLQNLTSKHIHNKKFNIISLCIFVMFLLMFFISRVSIEFSVIFSMTYLGFFFGIKIFNRNLKHSNYPRFIEFVFEITELILLIVAVFIIFKFNLINPILNKLCEQGVETIFYLIMWALAILIVITICLSKIINYLFNIKK